MAVDAFSYDSSLLWLTCPSLRLCIHLSVKHYCFFLSFHCHIIFFLSFPVILVFLPSLFVLLIYFLFFRLPCHFYLYIFFPFSPKLALVFTLLISYLLISQCFFFFSKLIPLLFSFHLYHTCTSSKIPTTRTQLSRGILYRCFYLPR